MNIIPMLLDFGNAAVTKLSDDVSPEQKRDIAAGMGKLPGWVEEGMNVWREGGRKGGEEAGKEEGKGG